MIQEITITKPLPHNILYHQLYVDEEMLGMTMGHRKFQLMQLLSKATHESQRKSYQRECKRDNLFK